VLLYLVVFIGILSFATVNIVDSFLSNNLFKSKMSLIFYGSITNVVFLPLIFIFELPKLIPSSLLLPIIAISLIEIAFLYPYYRALEEEDTSIIIALFSLGKILIPILAFLTIGERLEHIQYIGFFLIIFSSFLLSTKKHIHLNKGLFYMAIASVLISIDAVIFKYVLGEVGWVTVTTWTQIIIFVFTMTTFWIFFKRKILIDKNTYLKNFKYFISNEFFTFSGKVSIIFAYTLAPVSIVEGLFSAQPAAVLLIAVIGHRLSPRHFKETIHRKEILRKIILFIGIGIGVYLSM